MKTLVVANWKMNPQALKGANLLFNSVKKGIKNIKNTEVVVCPPFPFILNFESKIHAPYPPPFQRKGRGGAGLNLKLGAQNCFWEEKGAFTGEVSPAMLKDLGVEYVIIGHSERKRYLNETDEMVNKKLKAVLGIGLKPILCVGSKERNQKKEFREIKNQLKKVLSGIKKPELKSLVITYEPVWAISTTKGSRLATPKESREGANFIRKILIKLFDKNFAKKPRIIYGGSVDSKNVKSFIYEARMDGVLVGAASLNSKEFVKLVKKVSKPLT